MIISQTIESVKLVQKQLGEKETRAGESLDYQRVPLSLRERIEMVLAVPLDHEPFPAVQF